MPLLREGQIVRDTYEVERLLGEGAFAEVYRVRHRFLGRQALKVFKMSGMSFRDLEEMLGEALIPSRLGHPHITRVFEANTTETTRGTCGFFTMEYVIGGSLEQYWQGHSKPVATAVEVIRQVCSGLAQAHAENPPIIHRDVKPGNILVSTENDRLHVRLSDFGLAKRVNAMNLMTQAHGTITFKAPESFRGLGSDSTAGDIWALGCTLYLLKVARCDACRSAHRQREWRTLGWAGLGGLIGLGLHLLWCAFIGHWMYGLLFISGGLLFGGIWGDRRSHAHNCQLGVRPLSEKKKHPEVLRFKAQGWVFGSKPPTQ